VSHTRGPWKVGEAGPEGLQVDTADASGTVAECIGWRPDAHLIAAAPDLLDALRELLDATADEGDWPVEVAAARAAIAKAEGRAA
jgi:hypothetical protein